MILNSPRVFYYFHSLASFSFSLPLWALQKCPQGDSRLHYNPNCGTREVHYFCTKVHEI